MRVWLLRQHSCLPVFLFARMPFFQEKKMKMALVWCKDCQNICSAVAQRG